LREIVGRLVQRHFVDAQIGIGQRRQLVDRTTAGDEVLHHLRRHLGRIGRNAARSDAVIAGEDANARALDPRRMAALPQAHPAGDFLEPAERTGGLGQLSFARLGGGAGGAIGPRQTGQHVADFGETHRGGGVCVIGHFALADALELGGGRCPFRKAGSCPITMP